MSDLPSSSIAAQSFSAGNIPLLKKPDSAAEARKTGEEFEAFFVPISKSQAEANGGNALESSIKLQKFSDYVPSVVDLTPTKLMSFSQRCIQVYDFLG